MKKAAEKLVAILVILSVLVGVVSIDVFADSADVEYKTVAQHYYEKLGSQIPVNIHGSCGYVAMSILLSFYDVYWDDIFVNTGCENTTQVVTNVERDIPRDIPTIRLENEMLSEAEKGNEALYRAFIQNNASDYLHMYLLSLGIGLQLGHENDDENGFAITIHEVAMVLDRYFDDIFGPADYYDEDQEYSNNLPLTIHIAQENNTGETRESVLNKIRAQVDNGNPVIYRADDIVSKENGEGNNSNTENEPRKKVGHFMVAYYATKDGDISFHKGHTKYTNTTLGETEYNLNIDALWIEINEDILPHACSGDYTYLLYPGVEPSCCSCEAYKYIHPNHIHEQKGLEQNDDTTHIYNCIWGCEIKKSHEFVCNMISNSQHSLVCECGYSYEESHNFVYQDYHTSVCEDCGYVNTTSHVYGGFVYSSTQHWKECACGAQKQVGTHSYTYENFNAAKHKCICSCGYEKLSAHKNVVLNSQYTQCTFCKALFDSNGDHNFINKKQDDIEALLE